MKLNAFFLQEYGIVLCKGCGEDFKPRYKNQAYCSSQCRINYTNDNRRELYGSYPIPKQKGKFPRWTCQNCETSIQLTFDPIKESSKLRDIKCKKCHGE